MLEKGNRANTLHGILLIALFSFAAFYIAEVPIVKRLSFSPLIVGIVLGMLYANSLRNRLPETWVPGIKFCTKQVLRWGIILYGFRLTLAQVAAVGVPAVVVDLIVVTVTILGGVLLGRAGGPSCAMWRLPPWLRRASAPHGSGSAPPMSRPKPGPGRRSAPHSLWNTARRAARNSTSCCPTDRRSA